MKANRFRFRAWDAKNHKMIHEPLFVNSIGVVHPPLGQHVLMQSTGLCDGNGNEIFEGDIILADNTEFVVEYCQKTAGMIYRDITPVRERAFRFPYFTHYSLCEVSGVVVGNIHERGLNEDHG